MDNLTLQEASLRLSKKEVSATELTKHYLSKIAASRLNAFVTVDEKGALEAARVADKEIAAGRHNPLTGVPLAIKDVISTDGVRTTASSKILENYIPPFDATVIEKLKAQHAVMLGKTNLDEFAMGSSTENSAYGATLNPVDETRVPGGSSGGSAAAVAGDLCVAALGSDTGGSIRQPASLCGIFGFKPTYGRVSRYGLLAMASGLDQIGPLSKTALDGKMLFEAIAGYDHLDATSIKDPLPRGGIDFGKITIGLPKEYFSGKGLDGKVKESVEKAVEKLEKMGAKVKEISLPTSDSALAIYYLIMPVEVASNLARYDGIKYGASLIDEAKTINEVYTKTRSKFFGSEPKRRSILGTYVSSAGQYDAYYAKAEKARAAIAADFKKAFSQVDFIIGPTSPSVAFKFGEKTNDPLEMYLSDIYTVPINLAGVPAVSLPVEPANGLPVGMQIIGPRDSDARLLDLAVAFEERGSNG